MIRFDNDCRFHPGKHTFTECPNRCRGSNERRSKGRRYVNRRWRCHGYAVASIGYCRKNHGHLIHGT